MIRNWKLYLVLLLCCTGNILFAQIGISVALNRSSYMRFEHIFACVTLRNDTGRPLLFGKDPALQGFVLFDIRDRSGRPVPRIKGDELSVTGLLLGPGEVRKFVVPVDKYYRLDKIGDYKIHAYVSHNLLNNEYRSKDVAFRISEGIRVWHKNVGVPDFSGTKNNQPGEERSYSLNIVTDGKISSYYLVVEDDKHVYGVTKVGQVVGREKYYAEVDMLSRIHLMLPISPKVFHYLAFNTDGAVLVNSYWKTSGSIPMLFRDSKTGKVTRIGGVEARPGIDFKDPKSGVMTVSDIANDDQQITPTAPRDRGKVDLGKDVVTFDPLE